MVNGEGRTGLIKVCQVLQGTSSVSKRTELTAHFNLENIDGIENIIAVNFNMYVCIIVGLRGQESVE